MYRAYRQSWSFRPRNPRVLKPNRLFAARIPHKFSHVAVLVFFVGYKLQNFFLKLQPNRIEKDVFLVKYKLNTLGDIDEYFY